MGRNDKSAGPRSVRLLALAAMFVVTADALAQAKQATDRLTFGVYTTDKPTTMYKKFAPVIAGLEQQLSTELGRATDIQLRVVMSYDRALTALVEGKVDFVRFGPASYILAKQRNPALELLAMENKQGKKTFTGKIVVRNKSDIETLADLRGHTFAFGNKNSTVGRYLAQDLLVNAGVFAKDLRRHHFLDRHDKVFRAVQLKQFDAGSVKTGTFKKLNKQQQLRVLAEFEIPSKPWVARSGLPKRTLAGLRAALLNLEDESILKSLKIQGFFPTTDKDYQSVRRRMQNSQRFSRTPAKPPIK